MTMTLSHVWWRVTLSHVWWRWHCVTCDASDIASHLMTLCHVWWRWLCGMCDDVWHASRVLIVEWDNMQQNDPDSRRNTIAAVLQSQCGLCMACINKHDNAKSSPTNTKSTLLEHNLDQHHETQNQHFRSTKSTFLSEAQHQHVISPPFESRHVFAISDHLWTLTEIKV